MLDKLTKKYTDLHRQYLEIKAKEERLRRQREGIAKKANNIKIEIERIQSKQRPLSDSSHLDLLGSLPPDLRSQVLQVLNQGTSQ